jgi:hypothetical protein
VFGVFCDDVLWPFKPRVLVLNAPGSLAPIIAALCSCKDKILSFSSCDIENFLGTESVL